MTLRTGLPVLPNIRGVEEPLYQELIRIYNSLQNIASDLEEFSGNLVLAEEQKSFESLLSNITKLRVLFAEDAVRGNIAIYTPSGAVVGPATIPGGSPVQVLGVVANDFIQAGQYGDVAFRGQFEFNEFTSGAFGVLVPGNFYLLERNTNPFTVRNNELRQQVGNMSPLIGIATGDYTMELIPEVRLL